VLARRAEEWLAVRDGGVYLDATFGGGGYARAILETAGARVIGIDRDESAIAAGGALVEQAQGRLLLARGRFSNLETLVAHHGVAAVDGVVFDLGVSSMQIDQAERGFSFRLEGPLDMRMGREGPSAADVVALASERDLAAIIVTLGEERHARAVARAIVKARDQRAIDSTRALAEVVARVVHARGRDPSGDANLPSLAHFRQRRAYRIGAWPRRRRACAQAGGPPRRRRLPFARGSHRQEFSHRPQPRACRFPSSARDNCGGPLTFRALTRRPETPDDVETAANPRARSAKLRAAERTDAAPRSATIETLLPRLPSLADVMRGRA
jgi:16S rRNA (cytosine1402-N4)-methyltransferase